MSKKTDQKTSQFRQFLEKNLTAEKFKSLYQLPDWKKYSITVALKRPEIMSFKLLLDIAKTIEISPLRLAIDYDCSLDRMTAREYFSLLD